MHNYNYYEIQFISADQIKTQIEFTSFQRFKIITFYKWLKIIFNAYAE